MTIEVDPESSRVVQANMKLNRMPGEANMAILGEWAVREGMEVEC